nr:ArgP/LysG family DNA-binding transcriptional regulator [Zhihengliuella flava]
MRAFAAVIDAGTFDAAARRLGITPSAVSQRIRALERQAGTVVVRRSHPAEPTEAGHVLLRLARQVELVAQDAQASLAALGESGSGHDGGPAAPARSHLTVVVPADSLAGWFAPVLAAAADEESLTLEILRDDENASAEHLRAGRAMGAVTTQAAPVQGCAVVELGSLSYAAVANRDFAERWFGGSAECDPAGFARAPVMHFDRTDPLQSQLIERLTPGARPPAHYVPDSMQFAAAIGAGLGWGLLPRWQVEHLRATGDDVVPLGGHTAAVKLYWQRWRLDSPGLTWLTDTVRYAASTSLGSARHG